MNASGDRTRSPLAWAAFAVGYLGAYFVSTAVPTPLLWYFPLEHRFAWALHPDTLAMDFFGRVLLSLCAGLACFALAWWRPRPKLLQAAVVWMGVLLLFTGGLYVFLLSNRHPIPMPLPPGYVPR